MDNRLHFAALTDDLAGARDLLLSGMSPDIQDEEGFTPLHFAAQEYSVSVAAALLEAGASIDLENRFGNTPLFVAVFNSKGRGALIKLLRSHGANPHHHNDYGQTPLGLARLIANYDVAQYFADLET